MSPGCSCKSNPSPKMSTPSFSLLQTDPSTWGNPPDGKTFVGVNTDGALVIKTQTGISVLGSAGPALGKQSNSDGTAITVTPISVIHKEIITLLGTARTQVVNITLTGLGDGAGATILFYMPSTPGILVQIFTGATMLWSFQNDSGAPIKAAVEFYKDGTAWAVLRENIPAFTPAS